MNQSQMFNYVAPEKEEEEVIKAQEVSNLEQEVLMEINKETAIVLFQKEKGFEEILNKIKARVRSEIYDVTTEVGRTRIGSVGRQMGSIKARILDMALLLTEEWRSQTAMVNAVKKHIAFELDGLRDEVLAPRDEFIKREKDRVKAHEDNLNEIFILGIDTQTDTSEQLKEKIDKLQKQDERDWEEFQTKADETRKVSILNLQLSYDLRKKAEDDAAELARLKDAEVARLKAEHEKQIADEAAARAKKEAEDKAAEDARVIAQKALQDLKDETARADKAEADKIAADKKAKADIVIAVEKAEQAQKDKQKQEADKAFAEQSLRDADLEHRKKINNEALEEMLKHYNEATKNGKDGIKAIVAAIAQKLIPHVTIKY